MTDIWIPRYRDIEASPVVVQNALAAEIRMETFKTDSWDIEIPGSRRVRAEFPNLITDLGLNGLGNGAMENAFYIQVGEGNTPPTVADTSLATFTATKQNSTASLLGAGTHWVQTSAPYYGSHRKMSRFAAGFGGGAVNIAEVGIAMSSATSGNLFARALTVDGGGSPAAIPVDADEYLDVYYTLRSYPGWVDSDDTGSIDVSGTPYTYTMRAASVTSTLYWSRYNFTEVKAHDGISDGIQLYYYVYGSDAALGAITSSIASASSDSTIATAAVDSSYVTDSFQRKITYNWSLTEGNVTGGIGGWTPTFTHGRYQIVFGTPIPKTSSDTLALPMTFSWARKSI